MIALITQGQKLDSIRDTATLFQASIDGLKAELRS